MNESSSFSYGRFLSLGGCELVNYVEPFVTKHIDGIPESLYEPLRSRLAGLDKEHIVYALEICMLLRPREFAGCVVGFLSHDDSSVCCTAYRLIKSIQPDLMPPELVQRIAATPTVDLFTSDVRSGNRIRIGTNQEFVRDLVESLGGKRCTVETALSQEGGKRGRGRDADGTNIDSCPISPPDGRSDPPG